MLQIRKGAKGYKLEYNMDTSRCAYRHPYSTVIGSAANEPNLTKHPQIQARLKLFFRLELDSYKNSQRSSILARLVENLIV